MTIDLLSPIKMLVISEQEKSLSKPRRDGFIAVLNLNTSSSFKDDTDPDGISPDSTIFNDFFFLKELGGSGFFNGTEAAAIAQPFVGGVEMKESHTSAHFRIIGVVFSEIFLFS